MATVEDTFVLPSSWLRAIRPRRGEAPVGFSPAVAWAADVASLIAKRPSLRRSLTAPRTRAACRPAALREVVLGEAAQLPGRGPQLAALREAVLRGGVTRVGGEAAPLPRGGPQLAALREVVLREAAQLPGRGPGAALREAALREAALRGGVTRVGGGAAPLGGVLIDRFQAVVGAWVQTPRTAGQSPPADLDPIGADELVRDLEEAAA